MVLETKRLYLRNLTIHDLDDIEWLLKEEDLSFTFRKEFESDEVKDWIQENIELYPQSLGMKAIILKEDDSFIGIAGLVNKDLDNQSVLDLTCWLKKKYWKRGFALEACKGLLHQAFNVLDVEQVYSFVVLENQPSKRLAKKLGMIPSQSIVSNVFGSNVSQEVFVLKRDNYYM